MNPVWAFRVWFLRPSWHGPQMSLVAIGGIDQSRAREVANYAEMIAVISALMPKSGRLQDVQSHVEELNSIVHSGLS